MEVLNSTQNFGFSTQSRGAAEDSSQHHTNFDDFLIQRQIESQSPPRQSLSYFGNVSKEEFSKSLREVFRKMEEIIDFVKQQGDDKLLSRLNYLKWGFERQVDIYSTSIDSMERASEGLNSPDPKQLARNAEELNSSMLMQYAFGYGIALWAEEFFEAAGVKDSTLTEVAKIARYTKDTRDEVELNNGKTVKVGSAVTRDLNSKYLSYAEFNSRGSKLLESLLQVTNSK